MGRVFLSGVAHHLSELVCHHVNVVHSDGDDEHETNNTFARLILLSHETTLGQAVRQQPSSKET
jgi:hypothetical protein